MVHPVCPLLMKTACLAEGYREDHQPKAEVP